MGQTPRSRCLLQVKPQRDDAGWFYGGFQRAADTFHRVLFGASVLAHRTRFYECPARQGKKEQKQGDEDGVL